MKKQKLLWHNRVAPMTADQAHGYRGFRVRRVVEDRDDYVRCYCGWRPDLGPHYKVKGTLPSYRIGDRTK